MSRPGQAAPNGNGHPDGCALVTGASRGIGAAIARALAADGWPVAVNYRSDRESADAVVEEIQQAGGHAVAVQADVADPQTAAKLIAQLSDELGGPVLVLVNNAGMSADGLAMRIGDEQWDQVLNTNLSGAFRLTREVLGPMVRARFGRVVNVASVVGQRASPGQAGYAASKAGLVAFTKTVAAEVARRGVTVNAIAPGLIDTEMSRDVGDAVRDAVPARRAGTPDEVAACARFLASTDASYVTGATLTVDGGLSA